MVDLVDYGVMRLDLDVHEVFEILDEDQQQLLIMDFLQKWRHKEEFVRQLKKNRRNRN
jgi:hypothetical protein